MAQRVRFGCVLRSLAVLCLALALPAEGKDLLLSTTEPITIGGTTFQDEDLFLYDTETKTATQFFDGSEEFQEQNGLEDIDAVYLQPDGKLVLSTTNDATLGGVTFTDGDLVVYDPSTDQVAGFAFRQDTFKVKEDVNAIDRRSDDTVVFSTTGPGHIGSFGFGRDDLVVYDAAPSILFDGGASFAAHNENIDAADVLSDGTIVLSVIGAASVPGQSGPLAFDDDDLIRFNPATGTATLFFDGDTMADQVGIDIDALAIVAD